MRATPLPCVTSASSRSSESARCDLPRLVADKRVDLIDDDRTHRTEDAPTAGACEQDVERLRRRHEDVRGLLDHGCARAAPCVSPRAYRHAHVRLASDGSPLPDLGEGSLQVLLDVCRERFQRRQVKDGGLVREGRLAGHQHIDRGQKCRERLARPGRRGDERVLARLDGAPAVALGCGGSADALGEPASNDRVEGRYRHAPRLGTREAKRRGGEPAPSGDGLPRGAGRPRPHAGGRTTGH